MAGVVVVVVVVVVVGVKAYLLCEEGRRGRMWPRYWAATRGLRDQRNSHHRARNSSEKSKSDRYSALPVSDKLVLVGAMESDSSGSSSSGGWSGSSSGSDSGREGDICPDSSPDIRNYSPSSGSSRRATHSDNNILQKPPRRSVATSITNLWSAFCISVRNSSIGAL